MTQQFISETLQRSCFQKCPEFVHPLPKETLPTSKIKATIREIPFLLNYE